MITTILLSIGLMLVLAAVLGFVLGWADKALAVPVDPRVEAISKVLPGANCGACGYVGCGDYADALTKPDTAINLCPVGGPACAKAIGGILGRETGISWPMRPVVHCCAKLENRLQRRPYHGEPTCQGMNLVAGVQGCTYGCLGGGDCEHACDFDAIHIVDGLATVDYERCVGCGACAKVCPRKIITMTPFKTERILAVKCSNADFGKEVTEVCQVGCIGCSGCTKACAVLSMKGSLPIIDYSVYDPNVDLQAAIDRCPRDALVWVGKPSPKDLAATQDQPLPDVVAPKFETTVDKTEWRG